MGDFATNTGLEAAASLCATDTSVVRNIVFDLCGPIITIDIHRIDRNFQSQGVQSAEPYMDLHRAGITKLYDAGLISSEDFCQRVRSQFACSMPDSLILQYWNDVIVDCPLRHLQVIEKAHLHYHNYLLSNCDVENARSFPMQIDRVAGYPFCSQAFDQMFFSSGLKDRKPNPEVFNTILSRGQMKAHETLFIDDCRKHCLSAASVGLQVHWLQPGEDLQQLFDNDGRLL